MAKKPIRVYRGSESPVTTSASVPSTVRKPATVTRERVQIYRDGNNRDRLSITQQVVEYPNAGKGRSVATTTRYEDLLHCVYDAVLITDLEGRVAEVNARAEHNFRWTAEEMCEMTILDLISGADEHLLNVIHSNVENHKFTVLEAVCVNGEDVRFHAEIVVNQMGADQLGFFIRDVTQRKKIEEELKQAADRLIEAEKMQSRLDTLSTLFYELNNPLQILTCMAELDKNEEYKKQLRRILEVLDQLKNEQNLETVVDSEMGSRFDLPQPNRALTACDTSRLLVVDDESMLREMFVTALMTAFPDLKVDCAANGKEAVELFTRDRHALVVMDVSMPVMNGEEAFDEVARFCNQKSLKVPSFVFCTGFIVSDSLQAILNADPVHACLQKPLSINDLVGSVKKCLVR